MKDSNRTKCEIWTRVMGYYRTTKDFNVGKKQEQKERKNFLEKNAYSEPFMQQNA